jgi:hypothetical protein
MKHLTTLLVLIISLCACTQTPTEETFVNPLFFEKIYPNDPNAGYIKITPTSLSQKCYDGLTGSFCRINYTCKIMTNTEDILALKCDQRFTPEDIEKLKADNSYLLGGTKELFIFALDKNEAITPDTTEIPLLREELELLPYDHAIVSSRCYIKKTPKIAFKGDPS